MTHRLIPLIAALGLAACQPATEPADPIPAGEAVPAAVPTPQAVVETAVPVASPAPAAPAPSRAARVRPPAQADALDPATPPTPAPVTVPMTDHSGHDMSTLPATPKH